MPYNEKLRILLIADTPALGRSFCLAEKDWSVVQYKSRDIDKLPSNLLNSEISTYHAAIVYTGVGSDVVAYAIGVLNGMHPNRPVFVWGPNRPVHGSYYSITTYLIDTKWLDREIREINKNNRH